MDILKIKSINKDLIDKIQRYIIFLDIQQSNGNKHYLNLSYKASTWCKYIFFW